MVRPVRPVALVILTLCMIYPGVTSVFQGLYPFVAGDWFNLVGQNNLWFGVLGNLGLPLWVASIMQTAVGLAWIGGVLGLWAGEWLAYPLALVAALGSLLFPIGPAVMGVLGLICLVAFRQKAEEIPA